MSNIGMGFTFLLAGRIGAIQWFKWLRSQVIPQPPDLRIGRTSVFVNFTEPRYGAKPHEIHNQTVALSDKSMRR
jgi:hypothetical protein